MNDANKRFATDKPIKIKTSIVECVEQGRFCMQKFVPTRPGQTDTCLKCMQMLGVEIAPLPVDNKRNIWS